MANVNDINFQISNTFVKRLIDLLSKKGTEFPWAVSDKATIQIRLVTLKEFCDVCSQFNFYPLAIMKYLRMLYFAQPITFDLESEQVYPYNTHTKSIYPTFILFCARCLPNDLLLPDALDKEAEE